LLAKTCVKFLAKRSSRVYHVISTLANGPTQALADPTGAT